MTLVSVVARTFRPAGIDILLAGMRDQTFRDFEVILVDRRYERRHQEVMALAREYGVNLIHVPEHRRNGQWSVVSASVNTGFALARGHVVVALQDWTYCPAGWLEAHLQHHEREGCLVIAPYDHRAVGISRRLHRHIKTYHPDVRPFRHYAHQPRLKFRRRPKEFNATPDGSSLNEDLVIQGKVLDEISAFAEGLFDPAWLERMPPIPEGDAGLRDVSPEKRKPPHTWVHLKNESLLLESVVKLNGIDAWADRGGRWMPTDSDFGHRAQCLGLTLIWEPKAMSHCINPRHVMPTLMPFGDRHERVEGRWNRFDCQVYWQRRFIEAWDGLIAAPAPYTLGELSQQLEPWRTAEWIDTASLDIPDEEFYGMQVWPDTPYPARGKP